MKWFHIDEFDCPTKKGSGKNMDKDFLEKLDLARSYAKIPFKINSGYRTLKHNRSLNSKDTSSHIKGLASDIHCNNGQDRLIIVKALINAGFRRIGIANTFIHCDTDKDKPNSIWIY